VDGHERHHEPLGGCGMNSSPGTFHSTAVVSGGSWPASTRRRSCSRETLARVQFDIVAAESRASWRHKKRWCCRCERTRRAEGECERKKMMGKQSPEPAPDAQGGSATLHLQHRAQRVSETFTRACTPVKQPPTRVTPRFAWNMDMQCLRAVMMEWSRPSCRARCLRP
jgi:hypothetical protein